MALNIEKMRHDMRLETWRIGVSLIVAAAALVGAGVAIGNYLKPTPPAPPQVIILQQPAQHQ